jgi:hypothetical protein
MVQRLPVFALSVLLTACVASPNGKYADWVNQPAPSSWEPETTWQFLVVDERGRLSQALVVKLTREAAQSCTAGVWSKVEVLRRDPPRQPEFLGTAAYELHGSALTINLTANLCDANNLIVGRLDALGFSGTFQSGSLTGGGHALATYGARL